VNVPINWRFYPPADEAIAASKEKILEEDELSYTMVDADVVTVR
jgi:hypothetical protein